MERREQRGSLVLPVVIIGLGVLFLLDNLGLLGWSAWGVILHLWPVLLVAVGLDMLFGRRSPLVSLLITVVVLGAASVLLWLYVPAPAAGQPLATERVEQSLDGASRAEVEIRPGVANLRIASLSDSHLLVEGTVASGGGETIARDFYVSGDTAHFALRSRAQSATGVFLSGRAGDERLWDLRLNGGVPMVLKVSTGVGTAEMDLAELKLTDLDVDTGVGRTVLTLPARGQVRARVNGGVGEVAVTIPEGMAASIRVNAGIGSTDVVGNLQRRGDAYLSPGYDLAQDRVELTVRGGVGRVTVRALGTS